MTPVKAIRMGVGFFKELNSLVLQTTKAPSCEAAIRFDRQ